MPSEYVSHDEAAEILGVVRSTVIRLVKAGQLSPRGRRGAGRPGLLRSEVEALALERQRKTEQRRRDREAGEASRRAAAQRRAKRSAATRWPPTRPDTIHDWLTVQEAAKVMGVFRQAVQQLCWRGRMPFEWSDGQRWIRRDLLELRQRAQAAQAARQP